MSLVLKNVTKKYGDKTAVDKISFTLDKPCVFGLLGGNGAGKSTTIRMILGIKTITEGEITWNGKEVKRENVTFGYLPEERGVYPKVKVYDQLMYFAKLNGMTKEDADREIRYWAKEVQVEEYLNMTPDKLSKGNQQKVQFCTAVVHNPELVILDEPFSGMDPVNTEILKNVIIGLVKKGKYVIMSAHQMSTIEEFCHEIIMLRRGKTVLQGNLDAIKDTYKSNRLEINTKVDISKYIEKYNMIIENDVNFNYVIKIEEENEARELLEKLVKDNIIVNKFEIKKPTLNDIFIEKVGGVHE